MTDKTPDIMADCETLGTKPGCAVLAIGAVVFDPRAPWDTVMGQQTATENRFVSLVSLESCLEAGLFMEPGALRFWLRQDKAAIDEAFSGTTPLREALEAFTEWMVQVAPGEGTPTSARIWAHGATFDPPILAAAYSAVGMEAPWDFRKVRDTRTIFDAANVSYRGTHHTVISDCLQQAEKVCEAYAILGSRQAVS